MKRFVNIRIALVAALSMAAGIFVCYRLLFGEWYFAACAGLAAVAAVVVCALRRKGVVVAVVALAVGLFGCALSGLYYRSCTRNEMTNVQVQLTGRVSDLGRNGNGYAYYIEKCTCSDGTVLRGRVRVYWKSGQQDLPQTGDVVTVSGEINSVYPIQSEVDSYSLRHNLRYTLDDAELLSVTPGRLKPDEAVRSYVLRVALDYSPNNGGVLYALFTGDRNVIEQDVQWAFNRAGIVHLLAVSGLHVGFLASVICLVLKRFHLRPWVECLLVCVPLLFYAYVCQFTPSVMRAIIMFVCSYMARTLFSRYDMLTSMSWAAMITLCICPFYLFDVGFQLSFAAVFGIATLHPPIRRFLSRRKLPRWLNSLLTTVSVSLCCIASTTFVLLAQGSDVALFGAALNVLAIPVVSIALVVGLVGLLPGFFHYVVVAADALLQLVVYCAEKIAALSFATLSARALSVSFLAAALLMFAIGGFVRLNKLAVRIFYPVCCVLLVCSIAFSYVRRPAQLKAYVVQSRSDSIAAVLSKEGSAVLAGDFSDYSDVRIAVDFLRGHRVRHASLFIAHCADSNVDAVRYAIEGLDADELFLLGTDANDDVTSCAEEHGIKPVRQYPNSVVGSDICVRSVFDGGLSAVDISCGELNLCIAYGSDARVNALLDFHLGADVYLLPRPSSAYSEQGLVTLTPSQSPLNGNYGANKYGNFTIKVKSGKIVLSFR